MRRFALAPALLAIIVAAGCGSSSHTPTPTTATQPTAPQPTTTDKASSTATSPSGNAPGALQAEATAAATGDIPDNQVFLVFRNAVGGYSLKYPEGWAQRGAGRRVVFRDKNNIVRVVVTRGGRLNGALVRADVRSLRGIHIQSPPTTTMISGKPGFKVVYRSESAADAVTGKHVTLVVDRYYLWHSGKRAVVDLGTPQGVDNVDAYRMMIGSFTWL
jgi:hypothetical protein